MTRFSFLAVLGLSLLGLQAGCGGESAEPQTTSPPPVTTEDQIGDSEANAPAEAPVDADPLAAVEVNETETVETTARPSVLLKLMVEPVGDAMDSASEPLTGGLGL